MTLKAQVAKTKMDKWDYINQKVSTQQRKKINRENENYGILEYI